MERWICYIRWRLMITLSNIWDYQNAASACGHCNLPLPLIFHLYFFLSGTPLTIYSSTGRNKHYLDSSSYTYNLHLSSCVQGLDRAGGSRIIAPVYKVQVQFSPNTSASSCRRLLQRAHRAFTFTLTFLVDVLKKQNYSEKSRYGRKCETLLTCSAVTGLHSKNPTCSWSAHKMSPISFSFLYEVMKNELLPNFGWRKVNTLACFWSEAGTCLVNITYSVMHQFKEFL